MLEKFTRKQMQRIRGLKCPYCGSEKLDNDGINIEWEISEVVTCLDCRKRWVEFYKFAGAQPIREDE